MNTYLMIVTSANAHMRLDNFLHRYLGRTRCFWQKVCKQKRLCRGLMYPLKASYTTKAGDLLTYQVEYQEVSEKNVTVSQPAQSLDILYEDQYVYVINKKAGRTVHPGRGTEKEGTLVDDLMHHNPSLYGVGQTDRWGLVHRLDKGTSGCLLVAKTQESYLFYVQNFKNHVQRTYDAWVWRTPRAPYGVIAEPMGRDRKNRTLMCIQPDGRHARTDYRLIMQYAHKASHVRCLLHTGRTHQIRVHMRFLGCPVLGDEAYSRGINPFFKHDESLISRPALHASSLRFTTPDGKIHEVEAPYPQDIQSLTAQLHRTYVSGV